MRTFEEILKDIKNSCSRVLYGSLNDVMPDIIKAATKIYIVELENELYQKTRESIF